MKTIQIKLTLIILFAFGFMVTSCVNDDDFETPDLTVTEPNIGDGEIVSISSVLGALEQNDGDITLIEEDIYVEGFVISSDEAGNFFEEIIIQDKPENPTAGLRISVNVNPLFSKFNFGRRVLVKMQGLQIGFANGIPTVGRRDSNNRVSQIQESEIDDVVLRTPVVETIVPLQVSIQDFNNSLKSLYVQLDNVQFIRDIIIGDNRLTFAAEPDDQFDGERIMESCDTGNTTTLSTSTFADFRFLDLPEGSGSIKGVLSRNFEDDMFVFLLNSPEDINFDQERCDPLIFECGTLSNPAANSLINVDFEGSGTNQPVNIPGWTNYIEAGTETWETYSSTGQNASLGVSARVGSFQSGDASSVAWLITPLIPISSNQTITLDFQNSNSFSDDSNLQILFSSDWDGTEAGITSAEWGVLADAEVVSDSEFFGNWVSSGIVDLSCLEQDGYVAFKYTGSGQTSNDGTYEIDEIRINVE